MNILVVAKKKQNKKNPARPYHHETGPKCILYSGAVTFASSSLNNQITQGIAPHEKLYCHIFGG